MARSYNELKGYLDHYLGLLTSSDGEVNENPIDKVSLLNAFFAGLQRSLPKLNTRTIENLFEIIAG